MNWQTTDVFPSGEPDIMLVFTGLMALCRRTDNQNFEFCCHGAAAGHTLSYRIDTETAGGRIQGTEVTVSQGNIEFSVENAVAKDAPCVYQSNFGDRRDFSYVIDIEAIHGQLLPKKSLAGTQIIRIKNGLLYTIIPTTAIFEMRDDSGKQTMSPRRVAFGIGVNIFLDGNRQGKLEIAGQNPILMPKDGTQKIVFFKNECGETYDALNNDYKKRNDFYLNYENIVDSAASGNLAENRLKMVARRESSHVGHFAGIKAFAGLDEAALGGKNSAPCTAVAYGKTDGW